MKDQIIKTIHRLRDKIFSCLEETRDGLCYIDPVEHREIFDHYAQSHAGVGLIMLGELSNDEELKKVGLKLIEKLISTHSEDVKSTVYHADFNNFALAILLDKCDLPDSLKNKIEKLIIKSSDSRHCTVNWLPMRMYVNQKRYELTKDFSFKNKVEIILRKIKEATYQDGYVDDLLPKGLSFNLQYNVSTIATLLLCHEKESVDYDFYKAIKALIQAIPLDHDINYMGRGCNQMFAWGPWIFLLSFLTNKELKRQAVNYLCSHINDALDNDNMILNNRVGQEHYLWWDYHYASVYTAHLFFWLVLSLYSVKTSFDIALDNADYGDDSGFHTYRNDVFFAAVFEGRSKYLAERGPSLVGLGSQRLGMILKSSFAPWGAPFGLKHSYLFPTYLNHFGPYEVTEPFDPQKNRITRRMGLTQRPSFSVSPLFGDIKIELNTDEIKVYFKNLKRARGFFNLVVFNSDVNPYIELKKDGIPAFPVLVGSIYNQYQEVYLYQTSITEFKEWNLQLKK